MSVLLGVNTRSECSASDVERREYVSGLAQTEVTLQGRWRRRPRGLIVVFRSPKGDIGLVSLAKHVT